MSNHLDWNTLTPAQRNALIHEKVMGEPLQVPCTGFITWYPDPINKTPHGHWICSQGHSGYISDANYTGSAENHMRYVPIECYSESMDAALAALKYAMQQGTMDKEDLTYELFDTTWGDLSTFDALEKLCAWTPDFVCRALLLAYGIEIIDQPS